MEELQFRARTELAEWLVGKPEDWGSAIATRAAMRSLPYLNHAQLSWLEEFAFEPLRALIFCWVAVGTPKILYRTKAAKRAASAVDKVLQKKRRDGSLASQLASDAAYLAALVAESGSSRNVVQAVKCSAEAAANFVHMEHPSVDDFGFVADFPDDPAGQVMKTMWEAVSRDCEWLAMQRNQSVAARRLIYNQIWLDGPPDKWIADWWHLERQLLSTDENYWVWTYWFERRTWGERAAFDIPGDKRRVEDKKILRRLAEATDEDFWGKGHEYVNATLKGWLDEARERVAPPPSPKPLGTIKPDPQDARSPQFGSDATGRIAIKANAGTDQLRSDPQSLSRHARALQMAQRLGEALRNHNNAGYISEMVDDYVAAMGNGPEGADPSGLVFAGDQLREAIAKHRAAGPDDDLQTLPPSADRAASAYLSAHNMYVGSDPFLDDLDRTTRGPDAPLPAANPDEIRRVATIARRDDILAEPTYNYMIAASDAAPATYDQADRHSRFAAGLAQNFARYGIEFLWTYSTESAWLGVAAGVGVTVMVGPVAAAGGAVAGVTIAYHLARNIIANEAIYRKLLATSPAGKDNFNRMIRFLKSLPIKSLKDD
jgi:hypothetical protein